jgi:mono/diheme cytochrome c family protein
MSAETNPAATTNEALEPRARHRAVPIWLIILLLLLLYWGMVYVDLRGGGFDELVYTPFRNREEVEKYGFHDEEGARVIQGKQLYSVNCAVCHMEAGTGNTANGCPPLAGSDWVSAEGPNRIIRLVSKGANGPIEVNGQMMPGGSMLAIGDQMQGDEKQKSENIAAIITYIRKTFGKGASAVKPEHVMQVRAEIKDRSNPYTSQELKATPDK